jgi:hypothetical protein
VVERGNQRVNTETTETAARVERHGEFMFEPDPASAIPRGKVYLRGRFFANAWLQPEGWGRASGKWVLNRDRLAFELRLPEQEPFWTVREMLGSLDAWLYCEEVPEVTP